MPTHKYFFPVIFRLFLSLPPPKKWRKLNRVPKLVTNHAEKYEGSIQSKILLREFYFTNFWKMNALEDSTNTDR